MNEQQSLYHSQSKVVCWNVLGFYHINYSVRQGFPAPRTAVRTHVIKYNIFSRVFDIANQQLTCHWHFALLGHVDKTPTSPFSWITAVKTLKNPYRSQTVAFKPSLKKTNIRKEKPKATYSVALVMAFLRGWERKSTNERFAAGQFLPIAWRISSVGRNKVNKW